MTLFLPIPRLPVLPRRWELNQARSRVFQLVQQYFPPGGDQRAPHPLVYIRSRDHSACWELISPQPPYWRRQQFLEAPGFTLCSVHTDTKIGADRHFCSRCTPTQCICENWCWVREEQCIARLGLRKMFQVNRPYLAKQGPPETHSSNFEKRYTYQVIFGL